MSQKTYIARKGYDVDFGALTVDSLVVNTTTIDAGAITLADDELITLGTSSDVTMQWDTAANPDEFQVLPAADDSVFTFGISAATQKSFDIRAYGQAANGADYLLWDASASALLLAGDARLNFSSATVLAANTDGGIIKAGTALAPVTEDTADMKFISCYFDDGATSGESRGIYNKLCVTGAGGSGTALRSYADVTDVVAVDARGAHITLGFGATGTVSGSGQALTATLQIPDQATQTGTLSAITAEIYSDGDTTDPAGSVLSLIRFSTMGGAGTGDIDDDCALFDIDSGFTPGSGNMVSAITSVADVMDITNWATIRIRISGTTYYIPCGTVIAKATGF
jgi:hypothetical protein